MFLLLRGYRRGSRGLVLAGWLVSAWQVSLGFTLGLQYTYLLLVLGLLVLWHWWRGGSPRDRPGRLGGARRLLRERGCRSERSRRRPRYGHEPSATRERTATPLPARAVR